MTKRPVINIFQKKLTNYFVDSFTHNTYIYAVRDRKYKTGDLAVRLLNKD